MNKEEYEDQVKFVEYLQILKNQKKIIEFFSIENENKLSFLNKRIAIMAAMKSKKSGKKTGVSDICVVLRKKVLFVEIKRPPKKLKNGKLSIASISVSDDQVEFVDTVSISDVVFAKICFGFLEAKQFLDEQV